MLAETKRCSVAKRLPPPWAGMPVSVPQPVRVRVKKTSVKVVSVVTMREMFICIKPEGNISFGKYMKQTVIKHQLQDLLIFLN